MDAYSRFKERLRKDWKIILILSIIVILGTVVRLVNYEDVGYWGDDLTAVPTALAWFYPHPQYEYAGFLGHGEPALGHYFIGAGCMLSGEDFSGVQKMYHDFYPGRGELIGKQLVNAQNYCFAPVHIFGILFLILIAIFSYIVLRGRASIYPVAFFAFFPRLLTLSRWTKVDVIMGTFLVIGLLCLWKAYRLEKGTKNELIYFGTGAAFMGLTFAVRFTGALFIPFPFLLILDKYWSNALFMVRKVLIWFNMSLANKIQKVTSDCKAFIKVSVVSIISTVFFYLLPFKFKPAYSIEVYGMYHAIHGRYSTLGLYLTNPFKVWYKIFLNLSVFDIVIFLFGFFILIKIILKKNKTKNERFIIYLTCLYIVTLIITETMQLLRANIPYLIGVALLAGLAFSDRKYSFFSIFNIKKRNLFFGIFIIAYVAFSFGSTLASAPYYVSYNPVLCYFEDGKCDEWEIEEFTGYSTEKVTSFMKDKMAENETYLPPGGIFYLYLRSEEDALRYQFIIPYRQQTGKNPSMKEVIEHFRPFGRQIRYVIIYNLPPADDQKFLVNNYEPKWRFKMKDKEILFIYDMFNLTKKNL